MKFIIILLFIHGSLASPRLDPLVQTKKGLIRGVQATDGDYAMFMGIPYAKVNESNPFGTSLPYPDFQDTYLANDDTSICIQNQQRTTNVVGSLDCLRLNVYVPNSATTRNKLPVLLWIHGGRFQHTSGGRHQYGPKYLVKKDIILVTINYRVGIYGFMCLDTPDVPGNQGLKDQLRAIRWIKENIESFGGDSNKITIFGSSAGGVSVDYHLLSKQEKLFDKAITQSGTSLSPWAFSDSDRNLPVRVASQLGVEINDSDEAVEYLSNLDPEIVVAATIELSETFRPCIEKEFDGIESFITEYPINSPMPKVKDTPILIGYNNLEKLFEYANKPADEYDEKVFEDNLALDFNDVDKELVKIVRNFYIGDKDVSIDVKYELAEFDSDFVFIHPIHRSLPYLKNGAKVYHYVFKYAGGRNYAKLREKITGPGAIHSD
ncbi:PREDICTED: esterase FE4-like [Papilio xuthus]|uniref:Carboxylic ester hydrolase n=1 Tax=Papilio xuthus TaxID=66420 RepID=A0AAJ6Z1R2_PAPXU|nr:PREDICTED: esterase FE4-like [Papilio xuthus]